MWSAWFNPASYTCYIILCVGNSSWRCELSGNSRIAFIIIIWTCTEICLPLTLGVLVSLLPWNAAADCRLSIWLTRSNPGKLQSPGWRWQYVVGPLGCHRACELLGCGLARFPSWAACRGGRTAVEVLLSDCQYRKVTALYGQCRALLSRLKI